MTDPQQPAPVDHDTLMAQMTLRIIRLEEALKATPAPNGFRTAVGGLLSSKKALTALGTALALVAGKLGFKIDDEMAITFATIGVSLIAGFALEDVGKAKAKAKIEVQQ